MKVASPKRHYLLAFAIAGALAAAPAIADKGGHKDKEHKGKQNQEHREDGRPDKREDRQDDQRRDRFEDQHRMMVRDYYGEQFRHGRCPPGLKKKHNGCMPPGQAKKWQMGRPLPREVIYYPVPQPLVIQIGQPPSGYRYVRVASDILLIAIGTGMVVDAIQDLGRQ